MAEPTAIKGGKIRVLLGNGDSPLTYSAPCGFTQRSIALNKGLQEFQLPDCADPDSISWLGREATSLSMSINGEGVLANESIDTWLDAWESVDSVPAKVEWEFPSRTIVWTGLVHVENLEVGAPNGQRSTLSVSIQSDGEMVRTQES